MKLRPGLILGCGNPLLDIIATVNLSFLQKYELKRNDAVLASDKQMPIFDELVNDYEVSYAAGGSAQNSLRVCQWFLQKPNTTVFFGCVGCDQNAQKLEEVARADGVNVAYQHASEYPTGRCAVLVNGAERSLCADLSAAKHFNFQHLEDKTNQDYVKNAEYFYITGFVHTVCPNFSLKIAQHAAECNKLFMFNLSAPFVLELFKESVMKILRYVDILIGNKREAIAFAESMDWDIKDRKEIGLRIQSSHKENNARSRIVIITQSAAPVLLIQENSVKEFEVPKMNLDEIVDTNAAGDAFMGGFMSQLVQDKNLDVCVQCGIYAAQEILKEVGCNFKGLPNFRE